MTKSFKKFLAVVIGSSISVAAVVTAIKLSVHAQNKPVVSATPNVNMAPPRKAQMPAKTARPGRTIPWSPIQTPEFQDTPTKAQVVLHLRSPDVALDAAAVRAGLQDAMSDARRQYGGPFVHHASLTHIGVYLYSPRSEGMGQWVGHLFWHEGAQPEITLNEALIAATRQPMARPEAKEGLAEDVRRRIFYESVEVEDRAYRASEDAATVDHLMNEGWRQLARRHGISFAQFEQIRAEGISKSWPTPIQ